MAETVVVWCAECREIVEQTRVKSHGLSKRMYACEKGHRNTLDSTATEHRTKKPRTKYLFRGLGTVNDRLQKKGRKKVQIHLGDNHA